MALTAEQIAELQQKAKEAEELKERLEALAGNKNKVLDEYKQAQQRLKELEEAEKQRKQKELEEQGKLKELLEAARQDAEQARKEAEEARKQQAELAAKQLKERMRGDFMSAMGAAGAFRPDHLWPLFQQSVADVDGKTVVTYKGSELSPAEFGKRLRGDQDYAHHFKPQGGGGMGAPRGGSSEPATGDNPYITGNVTAQILLQLEKPEEAAKLQREAKAALAARAKAG